MRHSFVVAITECFEQFGIRHETQVSPDCPRLHVGFWVVDPDGQLHVTEVRTGKPFSQMQRVTVRVTLLSIKPTTVLKANRFNDERVTIPMAYRVPEPVWFWIFW